MVPIFDTKALNQRKPNGNDIEIYIDRMNKITFEVAMLMHAYVIIILFYFFSRCLHPFLLDRLKLVFYVHLECTALSIDHIRYSSL